jgi:hypothetical protein
LEGLIIKKLLVLTISLVILVSLFSTSTAGIVLAQQAGYQIEDFRVETEPTIDGTWSSSFEWADAAEVQLGGDPNAIFRIKHDTELITGDIIFYYVLVEVLDDTVSDAEDYLQICFAAANQAGGTPMGGTTPQTDCVRFDYVGHDAGGFTLYKGDGSSWVEETNYRWGIDVSIVDSFASSPLSGANHLIVEAKIAAAAFDIRPEYWIRVETYDESSHDVVRAWPAGSRDVPNDWGLVETINDTIPEFSSWLIIPLFATASLIVVITRKRLTKIGAQS